ncbi:MAG TPA: HigA family addiction module antitoxin [Gemmatimonadales bacterium]|nr:HigA family addiction module antitoxin [Gemmatimonadales bacterium]
MKNRMRPIHPGEILLEEYLKPMDMSANALAQAINVPANRISAIVNGERGITADTALRLSAAFGRETYLVEVFAHQGPLKGGQKHKLMSDAFKLVALSKKYPRALD